jgi:hypothetical protein
MDESTLRRGNQSTHCPTVDFKVENDGTHRLRLFPWALKIYRPLPRDLVAGSALNAVVAIRIATHDNFIRVLSF